MVRRLYLDGGERPGTPSPVVNGRRILFVDNDVTNGHTEICFALGNPRFGVARDVTIQRNRIHDCGRLPATNLDQGVYVAVARGTRIVGNWIYENADQGIQLYPDARGTYVAGNVIDGNGEGIIFGGAARVAARDNLVQGNVISNSRIRNNVEWHFDGPVGQGNVVAPQLHRRRRARYGQRRHPRAPDRLQSASATSSPSRSSARRGTTASSRAAPAPVCSPANASRVPGPPR